MLATPKRYKNVNNAPNGDTKIVADDYATDAPNNSDDDAGSTDSKTSPYSLKTAIMPLILLMMILLPPMMLPP